MSYLVHSWSTCVRSRSIFLRMLCFFSCSMFARLNSNKMNKKNILLLLCKMSWHFHLANPINFAFSLKTSISVISILQNKLPVKFFIQFYCFVFNKNFEDIYLTTLIPNQYVPMSQMTYFRVILFLPGCNQFQLYVFN